MRGVHLKDMIIGRGDELVFMREKERVDVVDELRDVRHDDLIDVTVKGVERQS